MQKVILLQASLFLSTLLSPLIGYGTSVAIIAARGACELD
jgi:hypothetical protein